MGFLTDTAIESKQSTDPEIISFRVVAASAPASPSVNREAPANQAALPEGWNHALISKVASVFTFALARPSRRAVVVIGVQCLTANRIANLVTVAPSGASFTVRTTDLAGAASDADFHVTILRFGSSRVF
jgi:hypothetical protein